MSDHLTPEQLKELRAKLQRRQNSGVTGYQAWIDVPQMLSLLAHIDGQAATIQRATNLIADLTDPGACEFDHREGCQAHGYLSLQPGDKCPQAAAAEWAATLDGGQE